MTARAHAAGGWQGLFEPESQPRGGRGGLRVRAGAAPRGGAPRALVARGPGEAARVPRARAPRRAGPPGAAPRPAAQGRGRVRGAEAAARTVLTAFDHWQMAHLAREAAARDPRRAGRPRELGLVRLRRALARAGLSPYELKLLHGAIMAVSVEMPPANRRVR